MHIKAILAASTILVAASCIGAVDASAHPDGCHSAHSCPSDHHTYIWYDGSGQGWSCARPGSDTYDPSRDTTTITYGGYPYYCYAYGSAPPPPSDADGDGVPDSSDGCPFEAHATVDGCAAPPPAKPRGYRVQQAERGEIVAELSFVARDSRYTRERVRIVRAGQVVLDEAVPGVANCDAKCERFVRPRDSTRGGESIWLRDLDGDGELEVVIDMWTGGASCCTFTIVYGLVGGGYRHDSELWGTGYRLRRLGSDGRWQFVGVDQRWKYAFACGACAPLPVRVWQYDAGTISVVTRKWPAFVRQEARGLFRRYLRVRSHSNSLSRGTTRAVLAAWVADQCNLGRCQHGLRVVRGALRRGELRRAHRYDSGPFEQAYVKKLKRMLRRFGYSG